MAVEEQEEGGRVEVVAVVVMDEDAGSPITKEEEEEEVQVAVEDEGSRVRLLCSSMLCLVKDKINTQGNSFTAGRGRCMCLEKERVWFLMMSGITKEEEKEVVEVVEW